MRTSLWTQVCSETGSTRFRHNVFCSHSSVATLYIGRSGLVYVVLMGRYMKVAFRNVSLCLLGGNIVIQVCFAKI